MNNTYKKSPISKRIEAQECVVQVSMGAGLDAGRCKLEGVKYNP